MVELSIVVPVLNEEELVPLFLEQVEPLLSSHAIEHEIIFVDDGSTDGTVSVATAARARNPAIRIVSLTRNFGKEAALTAGLAMAGGDAVIPMDVDLQDPPRLIIEFIRLWRQGYDVVCGQRVHRDADTGAKRLTAGLFYRIFNRMSGIQIEPNVGDFRLMSRRVVEATLELRERNRFMKGLFAWVGYPSIIVPYSRPPRAAGRTKFNYWKLWNFAIDGVTSFSTVPLRVWTYAGGLVAFISVLYMLEIIISTLLTGREVPGYASLMVVVLVLGAVQLISLGVIGEYLGRLYIESKQRPLYLVREQIGFDPPARQPRQAEAAPPPGQPDGKGA